jgi:hypothetical protein
LLQKTGNEKNGKKQYDELAAKELEIDEMINLLGSPVNGEQPTILEQV